MKVGKICPFRVYQNVQGACETECQLFIPGHMLPEGTCALVGLPALKAAIVSLDHTLANVGKTIAAK
jgi:hypothetical protein